MKLATIRVNGTTRAVRVADEDPNPHLVDLGLGDVGELLRRPDWRDVAAAASGAHYDPDTADFAPPVTHPSKVICVGHNYTNHIKEMGRDLPAHPTLFPKFADSLIGPYDDLVWPPETDALDWEAELVVIVGEQVRRADDDEAGRAIAGFSVMNDVSMRDWQFRTIEWTQGKIWDSSTPVGPYVVTTDEVAGGVRPALGITTAVNDATMQSDNTGTLLFDPVTLVRYISTVIRLNPGDLIATGTPAGVGHASDPQRYLRPGDVVETRVAGIGACRNRVVAP